jgi:hypothetical protein
MFNPVSYIETLHGQLKATRTAYLFCRVSGVSDLEEVLDNSKRYAKFLAVDDSQDGYTFRGAAGGFFERRQYTVFILNRLKYGDMDARAYALEEARGIFRSLMSRFIADKLSIDCIDFDRTAFYEVPPAFAQGTAGIYFIFTVQNPVDLRYDSTDWTT